MFIDATASLYSTIKVKDLYKDFMFEIELSQMKISVLQIRAKIVSEDTLLICFD